MAISRMIAAVLVAGIPLAGQGQAQTPGEVRIVEENDSLLNPLPSRTDRYYTQGLRLEWIASSAKSDAHFVPGITHADWCSLLCGDGSREGSVNTGYAVSQSIYTPDDLQIAAPQPNDRPWAGLLYGSRIARVSYVEEALDAQRQDRIEVSFGLVGPAALAKQAQSVIHVLGNWERPNGWHNQLRNEPIMQLRYEAALRWPRTDGGRIDFIPRLRANLGNALTSLEAEVTGRIGWNLSGFGVPGAAPLMLEPAASAMTGRRNALTGAHWLASGNFFGRAAIKAVAHNITLDGNTFASNDIRIARKPFVYELAVGMEFNIVGNFWLSYQFVHRSSDFERRNGRDAPAQQFGSATLTVTFGG